MSNRLSDLDAEATALLAQMRELPALTPKHKQLIKRQHPAELEPVPRRTTMEETSATFTEAQAVLEAMRCMHCKKPFCSAACPIGMPIPEYFEHLVSGDVQGAVDLIRSHSLFPSICSRVCPHEKQCESNCTVGKMQKDMRKCVSIGNIERFCSDYERYKLGGKKVPQMAPATGKKIAVVGAGPAGLAAAIDLATFGNQVEIFEAAQGLGGVLRYGIPEFRLPKHILDYELSILPKMGIECHTGVTVGKDFPLEALLNEQGFDAVFLGNGAGLALTTGVPGEDLEGVFTAEEYLKKGNLQEAIASGKKVVIVGGGNVAMDASRMAFRLGAESVTIVYRRTREQMPACMVELEEATVEGVEIRELRNPAAFISDETGRVSGAKLDVFKLGEPDSSGRARPEKIEGEEDFVECDTVVLAIGNKVSPEIKASAPALETNRNGTYIVKDPETGETSVSKVYAGGDAMHGPQTVVLAMKTGRSAALAIHKMLAGG